MDRHASITRFAVIEQAAPVPTAGTPPTSSRSDPAKMAIWLPWGVLADGEVAHARDRHLALQNLAALGLDLRDGVFDRLDGHRDPGP